MGQDFSEGLAVVRVGQSPEDKFGYIDRAGQIVIAPRFYEAGPFSEGLAAVETNARVVGNEVVDIKRDFIDRTGELKISDKFEWIGPFSEGLAFAAEKSRAYGYINHEGRFIIPPKFEEASSFSNGGAGACSDECRYINHAGLPVLTRFRATWPFSDGLAVIGVEAPQKYIDKRGHVIAAYSRQ